MGPKSGKMVQDMRVIGNVIWLMARVDLSMLMGISMKGRGLMIKRMEEGCIFTLTVQCTMSNGEKTNKKVKAKDPGQVVQSIKEHI